MPDSEEDFSIEYKRAIATLAERLNATDFIHKVNLRQLIEDNTFPWDVLVKQFPQAQEIAHTVNVELNYELSINQCFNALVWIDRCDPSEWKYLLH